MNEFSELQSKCCEANILLHQTGLVNLTFGNVSVADREKGVFAIKPSGVPYGKLKPEDIVVLSIDDGLTRAGKLKPSTDTPTHMCLFQAFAAYPDIVSIVHTHSPSAVAFAQAGEPIPCYGTTHADYFYGEIPVTRYPNIYEVEGNYEWETGCIIAERFKEMDPTRLPAVLVRGHGPFTWGTSGVHAVEVAQALELVADIALKSMAIEPSIQPLPRLLLNKHFSRKHGSEAYYGQP
jgi:L-ribulose-5-phosphate 4-epimerase